MDTGSKAEFARKYGYSKAAVTQFDKAKKIVYVSPGVVDFIASKNLIDATGDPARTDVRQRHARNRGEIEINTNDVHESFQKARAIKQKYEAMMAKLEFEKEEGSVVEWANVEKMIADRGIQFKDGLLSMSRRIAPKVAGIDDIKEIESIIMDEVRSTIEEFRKPPSLQ